MKAGESKGRRHDRDSRGEVKETSRFKEEIKMPVRVGNSYVTEAALAFAQKSAAESVDKEKTKGKGTSGVLAELAEAVGRRSILMGYHGGRLAGFIGEHLEGSMGMLYVFPEFRRRGFGAELQRALIADTMDRGFIPFGQVEKDNLPSLALQKKLGMTISNGLIVWMWKE